MKKTERQLLNELIKMKQWYLDSNQDILSDEEKLKLITERQQLIKQQDYHLTYHRYLVKDIMINNSMPFEVQLPTVYNYPHIDKMFLRTYVVHFVDIDYSYERILNTDNEKHGCYQSNEDDIFDCQMINVLEDKELDDYITLKVTPLYSRNMVVSFSDDELEYAGGDVEQAVYDKLFHKLKIDFLYSYTV